MPIDRIQPSDAILYDENLNEEDRNIIIDFMTKNKIHQSSGLFDQVKEKDNLERMDFAIKAILDHIIKKRGGGEDGNT